MYGMHMMYETLILFIVFRFLSSFFSFSSSFYFTYMLKLVIRLYSSHVAVNEKDNLTHNWCKIFFRGHLWTKLKHFATIS